MNGILYYLTRRYLARANSVYVHKYPQVACFSFDLITQFIQLDGRYEKDELDFLSKEIFSNLSPSATCIDIGANIGNHSLAFSPYFARVFAIEPHPRTFRLLQLNAELSSNIIPINVGLSDHPSQLMVIQNRLNLAATSVERTSKSEGEKVHFNLKRLDDITEINFEESISFIKIDVEGHEAQALAGAECLIRRHKPIIAMEVLDKDVSKGSSKATEVLRSFGYQYFYELREAGLLGRLPRKLKKLTRSLIALTTGRRPAKAQKLAEIKHLENRTYLMLLCSVTPLSKKGVA